MKSKEGKVSLFEKDYLAKELSARRKLITFE
jgi:hypothetical protein